tara:strand:- start:314 stop:922 length:609 start_codon:yes stop_codon:yes gene_type:complete
MTRRENRNMVRTTKEIQERANVFAALHVDEVMRLRDRGFTLEMIADNFNSNDIPTARGGKWRANTILNIISRTQDPSWVKPPKEQFENYFEEKEIMSKGDGLSPCIIYIIECKKTNKIYVGQTSKGFKMRISLHRSRLKLKRFTNSSMQADYDEHGPESFEYSVLKELTPNASEEERLAAEKESINKFLNEGRQLYNKYCPI